MSLKGYIKENLPWIRSIYRKRLAPINLIHNIYDKPVVVLLYHRVLLLPLMMDIMIITNMPFQF